MHAHLLIYSDFQKFSLILNIYNYLQIEMKTSFLEQIKNTVTSADLLSTYKTLS